MSDSGGNAEKAAEYEQPDGQKSPNSEGIISSSDDGDEESSQTPFNGKRKKDHRQCKSKKSRVETSSSASSSISEGSTCSSDSVQGTESEERKKNGG